MQAGGIARCNIFSRRWPGRGRWRGRWTSARKWSGCLLQLRGPLPPLSGRWRCCWWWCRRTSAPSRVPSRRPSTRRCTCCHWGKFQYPSSYSRQVAQLPAAPQRLFSYCQCTRSQAAGLLRFGVVSKRRLATWAPACCAGRAYSRRAFTHTSDG